LLRMMAPLLILLGAPLTPMLRGLPRWILLGIVRPTVRHPLARAIYEKLTNPVISVSIFMGVLYLWQFPGGFNLALRNEFVHAILLDRQPLVDIAHALNMTVGGIVAHQSALKDGERMKVPQYSV